MLDGKLAPASGQITMDRGHLLESAIDRSPGSRAPAFSGVTSDGRTVKLSDYSGKYVFVDFSEVTCPGSVNEASYLQAHLNAWKARGMEILTVLVFNDANAPAVAGDLQAWQTTYRLSFPVISDPGQATAIYNSDAILNHTDFPSGYIIDPAGVIRYRFIGFDGPTIDAAVAALFP
jgi:peroxiredoxin